MPDQTSLDRYRRFVPQEPFSRVGSNQSMTLLSSSSRSCRSQSSSYERAVILPSAASNRPQEGIPYSDLPLCELPSIHTEQRYVAQSLN